MMYNILLMEDTNLKVQPTDNIPKILEDIHDNINIIIEEKNEPKIPYEYSPYKFQDTIHVGLSIRATLCVCPN